MVSVRQHFSICAGEAISKLDARQTNLSVTVIVQTSNNSVITLAPYLHEMQGVEGKPG